MLAHVTHLTLSAFHMQRGQPSGATSATAPCQNRGGSPRACSGTHGALQYAHAWHGAHRAVPHTQHSVSLQPFQDLPLGTPLPTLPQEFEVNVARAMAQFQKDAMPSRVCAVCSCLTCFLDSQLMAFHDVPNKEYLRADVLPTAAVPRWAHTVYWHELPPGHDAQAPPHPPPLPHNFRGDPNAPGEQDFLPEVVDGEDRLHTLRREHSLRLVRSCAHP